MILSIITVNLNNASGLLKTINSVHNQTFTDYEHIIIDGGSSDGSLDIIKTHSNRISFWISEPDKGIYYAMNKGVIHSKGEYLQFLNSGDWLVDENILSRIFNINRTADIIYGNMYEISSSGHKKLQESLHDDNLTMAHFNSNTHATIQHPASFINRAMFNKGLYDESYQIIADIKFFIERIVMQNCTVDYLPYPVSYFNLEGLSSNPSNWGKTIEERGRIFKEFLPARILKDYEILFQIKDSPLLKYIPFLENTNGLNKLVTWIVKSIIKIYQFTYRKN